MRRRLAKSNEATVIILTEPVIMEELEPTTIEDYQKLDQKCDQVMTKIKDRKKKANK
jgi:hypothetical protein